MLLIIDFQPAYLESFLPLLPSFKKRVKKSIKNKEKIVYLYNDSISLEGEKLGDSLENIISWSVKEKINIKNFNIIKKNFGFVSHKTRLGKDRIISTGIIEKILEGNIEDSSKVEKEHIIEIIKNIYGHFEEYKNNSRDSWIEIEEGAVALPFTFESKGGVRGWLSSLKKYKKIEIIGGFKERCLDEICILLDAKKIKYTLNNSLIYSVPPVHEPIEESEKTILIEAIKTTTELINGTNFHITIQELKGDNTNKELDIDPTAITA